MPFLILIVGAAVALIVASKKSAASAPSTPPAPSPSPGPSPSPTPPGYLWGPSQGDIHTGTRYRVSVVDMLPGLVPRDQVMVALQAMPWISQPLLYVPGDPLPTNWDPADASLPNRNRYEFVAKTDAQYAPVLGTTIWALRPL